MKKSDLYELINGKAQEFISISDQIWEYAELSLQEYKSAALYKELLKKEGFTVEENVAGIETAFTGTYGSGRPVIGILAEFDALSGLSQEACATQYREMIPGGNGHGCGHELLGAGSFAAAVAIKAYLEEKGEGSGTVIFYGCPGEEGGAAKAFMAREEMFCPLDAALTWHPGDANAVITGSYNTSIQVEYKFTGIAAHAAGNPHMGRSALDAVELMNVAANFLREHIPTTDRLHYSITDAGGVSPNVVQAKAQVLYMIRSDNVPNTKKLLARLDKIAEGAAMMTETTLSRRFIDGTADCLTNEVLEKTLHRNFEPAGMPHPNEKDWEFAKALYQTYDHSHLPGDGLCDDPSVRAFVLEKTQNNTRAINDFLVPYFHSEAVIPGSTDVGDVSWQTPTAQFNTATWPSGSPGHSWQNVSAGKSDYAHKSMLYAARILAGAAYDLFEDPELLRQAQEEFKAKTALQGYICPIEEGAVPVIAGTSF